MLGRGYYYLVAPGVVCHETGHALGCLMTGTKIVDFQPFRIQGNELGHVAFQKRHQSVLGTMAEFMIGIGPIWFGCLVIVLLTKMLSRRFQIPDFKETFPLDPYPSSRKYWIGVCKAAGRQFICLLKVQSLKSPFNILYLYLVFCIASELALSPSDFGGFLLGFGYVSIAFLLLNIIPMIGIATSAVVFRSIRFLFCVHATMVFVLFVAFLFLVLFAWPIKLILF